MSSGANVVFPYAVRLQEGGRADVFPAAEVFFPTASGEWASLLLVIDSGASISALPASDARVFDLNPAHGIPMPVSGIGARRLIGRKHELNVRLGQHELLLPLVFLPGAAPRILGRAGIFPRFTVIFEEARKRSAFLHSSHPSARNVTAFIDSL